MEKIIKSSVSVPEYLYVTREADAQLAKVITEMSRPGYISVARQMGKTSLLQRIKKQLQGASRTIIYFDLSAAVYGSAQQFFRHIIDTILEVEEELLRQSYLDIALRRKEASTSASPSGEYDKELRLILRELPSSLVLIFDEVDALAKASFSDEVFAQIRSVYFMRNTHTVLHNVTYILSGVIEPAKLIKNKDNSPFNIATQIFLDDFSFDEYSRFVISSKLAISAEVAVSIYDWTSGNPRMTYEVCSAVEDRILMGEPVSPTTIETLVHELYLVQFNRAPIDHIREVVLKNSLVRNAIKIVRKGGDISDESVGQLYLYGIIASRFKSSVPRIKNRILNAALSDTWLREAELQQKDLYTFGIEQMTAGDFSDGITSLIQYLENENLDSSNRNRALSSIANAYHKINDYDKSNEYLNLVSITRDENPEEYYFGQSLRALNFTFLGQVSLGIELLQDIIDNANKSQTYYSAVINQTSFKLNTNFEKYHSDVYNILKLTIAQATDSDLPVDDKNSIICSLNFKLGNINIQLSQYEESCYYLQEALKYAIPEMKPSILIGLLVSESKHQKVIYAEKLRTLLVNKSITLQPKFSNENDFTQQALHQSLGVLYEFYQQEYIALVMQCAKDYYNNSKPLYVLLYEIGNERVHSLNSPADDIFHLALNHKDITTLYAAKCKQGIALSSRSNNDEFRKRALAAIDAIEGVIEYGLLNRHDLLFAVRGAISYRAVGNFALALRFISYLTTRLDSDDELSLPGDCIAIYHIASSIYTSIGNIAKATVFEERALQLVSKWQTSGRKDGILLNEEAINEIIVDLNRTANSKKVYGAAVLAKVAHYNKIPRNTILTVRYVNGQVTTGKAKKFLSDLEVGKCVIL
ncbi:AAA-like domain-containing protein [Hymenobacter lucidus]|uniref:AAA-like domain-containing protein n=1 Tax=Hymenobacter lucidus TaxID=2880930 RepID=A0ABS8AZ87_9BACT|nr:AAA-like domain-containing protein [Hymenobacter lucidus]MCB2411125.1 AAA-like domain-containing protein [Hymenobacter lucidus]